ALGAGGRAPDSNGNMAWAGHCAYVAGPGAVFGNPSPAAGDGVAVVDVSDPTAPRHVSTLRSPGAQASMETIHAVETRDRAVLVVGQYGNQAGGDKPMDVYDVRDCAHPRLLETYRWPKNIHNLTISGNGRYVFATQPLQAADISPLFDADPATKTIYLGDLEAVTPGTPVAVGPTADLDDTLPDDVRGATHSQYLSHEAWPTADGATLYVGGQLPVFETFSILDLRDWLRRDATGNPAGPPKVVSQRQGRGHSVRTATIGGRPFVLHSEESVFGPTWGCLPETLNPFAGPAQPWLTDISDPSHPRTVSQFGLAINDPANCPAQIDSGVSASVHYHDVDDPARTTFVVASMWNSGVRVFDVRDPVHPKEVAYFNPGDVQPGTGVTLDHAWAHVRWVPTTGQLWFATSAGGFWVAELEPQVRAQLGLGPSGRAPLHPTGRPARRGVATPVSTLRKIDATAYYCTLGVVPT
ncbi:MAG: hypothetical protein JWN29_255, partial [Acidimicrobiales bacterium]|nr:hypothetical protein [Acidimicrobiales bacterium]